MENKGEGWKHPENLDRCRVIKSRPLLSISFPRHSPFSSLFRLLLHPLSFLSPSFSRHVPNTYTIPILVCEIFVFARVRVKFSK